MDAFRRVFWKESRVQAHIWIALAIGILLLQGIVVSSELVRQSYISPGVVTALFIVTSVIGVCYAAASASILVAGEREDETAFLLRTFPIPRTALLGGKLSFTLASLFALILFGFVSAAFLGGMLGRDRLPLPDDLWAYARSMGGAIAWGLLFSLLVDRVMIALGLAIGAEIVVVGILGNFLPAEWREPVYWTIVLGLLALDLVLATRWLAGESLAPAALWKPSAAAPRAEGSTRWLRLLQRIVASGSPERRATGALAWRELRGAIPFSLAWCVIGIVLVDLVMRMREKFPAHFFFLALTPAICGLMTALGDQRKSLFRFYADRGISPLRIWSVKIMTWLCVATLFLLLFGWYDATFTGRFDRTFGNPIGPVLQGIAQSIRMQLIRFAPTPTEGLEFQTWNLILSLCLMLFAIGQWAAFLRGQAVVAVALTMGLGFVAVVWHFVVLSADVPLLWTTWPVTLAGLAATAWNSSRWLEEDHRWPTTLRRAAWFLVPILAVLVTARTLRITSIPEVPLAATSLPFHQSLGITFRNPETEKLLRRYPGGESIPNPDSFSTWSFSQTARSLVSPAPPPEAIPALPQILPPGSGEELLPRAALPNPDDSSPSPAPMEPDAAAAGSSAPGMAGGESGAARRSAEPPEPIDPATLPARWDGLLDLIATSDRAAEACIDWSEWIGVLESRQKVLQAARDWGRIPGQSLERLDAAILDLQKLPDYPSAAPMLRNRRAVWRAYAAGGPLRSWGQDFAAIGRPARLILTLMGEQARSLRLADVVTEAALRHDARPFAESGLIEAAYDRNLEQEQARIGRWLASSYLVPYPLRYEPVASAAEDRVVTIHRQNAAAARLGTITCLLLQRYRLEHGEFPATLADVGTGTGLSHETLAALTRDPFTGDEFRYRRDGFPSPIRLEIISFSWQTERTVSLPARQPLLWSPGPGLRSIVALDTAPPTHATNRQRQTDVWAPAAVSDFAKTPHADQVDFLILPP